jgi:hypothetical protein
MKNDILLNKYVCFLKMNPIELTRKFVPLIFDINDIINTNTYDPEGNYVFPKTLELNYNSIYEKQIVLIDIGNKFIIFINTQYLNNLYIYIYNKIK